MKKALITALLFLGLTCSCVKQTAPITGDSLPDQVKNIAVLPVTSLPDDDINSKQQINEIESGVNVLNEQMEEYFSGNDNVRVVSPEEIESLSAQYNITPYAESIRIGTSLDAEAVMIVVLKRYNERKGTQYAATSPASVAFEYRLIHTKSGKSLCGGTFSEAQQSATENLLSLKKLSGRGFKWINASDLIREGISSKFSSCSYLK